MRSKKPSYQCGPQCSKLFAPIIEQHETRVPTSLPRRPVERSAAEQVQMQMIDRLARVGTTIDGDPKAAVEMELLGQLANHEQQMPEQHLVLRFQPVERGNLFFRNEKNM